jgi:hypothetical protein
VGLHLEVKRSKVPSEPLNTAPEVPKLATRADHLRLFASRREIYRASLVTASTELTTFLRRQYHPPGIQPFREYSVHFPLLITLGDWFEVTAPNGKTSIEQQTDIGPSAFTGCHPLASN